MSPTMRATILACVVTVCLSIGGAWGVLQTSTITQGNSIEVISKRIEKILNVISEQQKQINKNNLKITENKKDVKNIEASLCELNENLKGLNKNILTLSKITARLDERINSVEKYGK